MYRLLGQDGNICQAISKQQRAATNETLLRGEAGKLPTRPPSRAKKLTKPAPVVTDGYCRLQ